MTKNPLINALVALTYIAVVASVMNFGTKMAVHPNPVLAPIAFISLFTLSAAVMAYIFCYQPAQLYFENKKKVAVDLFLKTLLIFGGITFLLFMVVFSGLIK